MRSKAFRDVMARGIDDLSELRGAIEGARALRDRTLLGDMMGLYDGSLLDLGNVVLEYVGERPETFLGAGKRPSRWPKEDQAPASILADMRFMLVLHEDFMAQHADVDPGFSSEAITVAFERHMALMSQKMVLGRLTIMERDPAFWTKDMGDEFKGPLDFYRRARGLPEE